MPQTVSPSCYYEWPYTNCRTTCTSMFLSTPPWSSQSRVTVGPLLSVSWPVMPGVTTRRGSSTTLAQFGPWTLSVRWAMHCTWIYIYNYIVIGLIEVSGLGCYKFVIIAEKTAWCHQDQLHSSQRAKEYKRRKRVSCLSKPLVSCSVHYWCCICVVSYTIV